MNSNLRRPLIANIIISLYCIHVCGLDGEMGVMQCARRAIMFENITFATRAISPATRGTYVRACTVKGCNIFNDYHLKFCLCGFLSLVYLELKTIVF